MKVLIVRTFPEQMNLDSYNCQEIGLARALRKQGIPCDIVLFDNEKETRCEDREDGIRIYWVHGVNFIKNGMFPGLKRIMDGYDVIQVHEYDQIQSWVEYSFSRKRNVVVYHGPYYDAFNKGYNTKCAVFDRVFLPFSRYAKKNCRCLTKSPMAEAFLRAKGFEKVTAVGVGLDPAPFEKRVSDSPAAGILPGNRVNLLYVGKLEARRNIPFLMDVVSELNRRELPCHMTIIGSGEKEYVKDINPWIEKEQNEGRLTYFERLPQADVAEIYRQADLMLFPSNYEIYGMVLMEAMYFGIPVISSRNGGSSLLIEDGKNGRILSGFDVKEWADAAAGLILDPVRLRSMQQQAEKKIREEFLWDKLAGRFIAEYRAVLGEGSTGQD